MIEFENTLENTNEPSTVNARRKRKFSGGFRTEYLNKLQKFSKKYHYNFTEKKENNNHILEFKTDKAEQIVFFTDSKTESITATNTNNDVEIYKTMIRLGFLQFEPPIYIYSPNATEKQKILQALKELVLEDKKYDQTSIIDNNLEFENIEKELTELSKSDSSKKEEIKSPIIKPKTNDLKNNTENKNHTHSLDDNILKPIAQGQEIFIGQPEVKPNFYRLEVYNDLDINTQNITPVSKQNRKFENKNYQDVKSDNAEKYYTDNKNPNIYLGKISLDFTHSDKPQPLPSISTQDELLKIQSNTDLKLTYCKSEGLYYVSPIYNNNSSKKNKIIDITFVINATQACQPVSQSRKKLDQETTELFKNLRFGIDGKILRNSAYHELINLDKKLLLEYLTLFCQEFDPKSNLSSKSQQAGIERLNLFIEEHKGVCRHRALVFKALADAFGFDTRVIYNNSHVFIEIANDHGGYQAVDLGGAPTPANTNTDSQTKTQNPFANFANTPFSLFSPTSDTNNPNVQHIDFTNFMHFFKGFKPNLNHQKSTDNSNPDENTENTFTTN